MTKTQVLAIVSVWLRILVCLPAIAGEETLDPATLKAIQRVGEGKQSLESILPLLGIKGGSFEPSVTLRAPFANLRPVEFPLSQDLKLKAEAQGLTQLTTAYAIADGRSGIPAIVFTTPAFFKIEFLLLRPELDKSQIGLYEYVTSGFSREWERVDKGISISSSVLVAASGQFSRSGVFAVFAKMPPSQSLGGYKIRRTAKTIMGEATYAWDSQKDAYVLEKGMRALIVETQGEGPFKMLDDRSEDGSGDLAEHGSATVRFRLEPDGTVVRVKSQSGFTSEVPLRFLKGSWEEYLRGADVEMEITEEGYRKLSKANETAIDVVQSVQERIVAGVLGAFGYVTTKPRYGSEWPARAKLHLNKSQFKESEQIYVLTSTMWVRPK